MLIKKLQNENTKIIKINASEIYYENRNTILSNLLDLTYPVGSIYISVISTNPSNLFGGTWVAWSSGRVPVGVDTTQTEFSTVEKTGGSKELQSHSHTGTTDANGNHNHSARWKGAALGQYYFLRRVDAGDDFDGTSQGTNDAGTHSHTFTTNNAGSGDSGNLQPYITCYMWKRTA